MGRGQQPTAHLSLSPIVLFVGDSQPSSTPNVRRRPSGPASPGARSHHRRLLPARRTPSSRSEKDGEGEAQANAPAEVVYDPSSSISRRPRLPGAPSAGREWHNFMGSSLSDMYTKPVVEKSADTSDDDEPDIDIGKLLKDVELFGASSFKERKKIENRRVVELGGKAVKKHRTPLSVAKPALKNQKEREQRKMEEEKMLGIFRKGDKNIKPQKTRPEDRVLRATEGHFKNGILNVKHLMGPPRPSNRDAPEPQMRKGGKKGKGKQKGGRRKRR